MREGDRAMQKQRSIVGVNDLERWLEEPVKERSLTAAVVKRRQVVARVQGRLMAGTAEKRKAEFRRSKN